MISMQIKADALLVLSTFFKGSSGILFAGNEVRPPFFMKKLYPQSIHSYSPSYPIIFPLPHFGHRIRVSPISTFLEVNTRISVTLYLERVSYRLLASLEKRNKADTSAKNGV